MPWAMAAMRSSVEMKIMASSTGVFFIQKTRLPPSGVNKEHPGVRCQIRAIHQPLPPSFGAIDDFDGKPCDGGFPPLDVNGPVIDRPLDGAFVFPDALAATQQQYQQQQNYVECFITEQLSHDF